MRENVRKINDRFEHIDRIGASDIYRKFKLQFEAMFNPKEIARNKEEFRKIYVNDSDFEEKIEDFRNSIGNMAAFCVGYTGIGKTTSIRYCFDLGVKNVPVYIADRKELIFPSFFDGHNNLETDISEDLASKILAVCSFLERKNPDLKRHMRTERGLSELVEFIQETKPEIVEVDPLSLLHMSEKEEVHFRLEYARDNHKYSYYAIRLKYMIMKKYDKYQRLIIILDDVESLPHDYQQELIRLYLSLFECMTNTEFPQETEYNINLLISLRPHTFRLFNNNRNLETYPISANPITKDRPINLSEMFQKRFDYYTETNPRVIGNIDSWKECYDHLKTMNEMFSGQYKSMIINLCFMNIREALSYYARIFANRLWVQKNKELYAEFTVKIPDYTFNNITIIRALACNESKVYFDEENNLIPCIFLNNQRDDYTICCLLLLNLFYKRRVENVYYGVRSQKKKDLMEELEYIFSSDKVKIFEECLYHLFEKRILRKSIRDKDDYNTLDRRESLKDDSFLYLSSKGEEMWRMLSQDSVLLELFREEVYRDYDRYDFNEQSSFELMEAGKQKDIFLDLLKYIEFLSYKEDDLRNSVTEKSKQKKYKEIFGTQMMVSYLLEGVNCSLRYSGKCEDPDIQKEFSQLLRQLYASKNA